MSVIEKLKEAVRSVVEAERQDLYAEARLNDGRVIATEAEAFSAGAPVRADTNPRCSCVASAEACRSSRSPMRKLCVRNDMAICILSPSGMHAHTGWPLTMLNLARSSRSLTMRTSM